jgi:pimeloyl-ACP methyl ester carboxylesterase
MTEISQRFGGGFSYLARGGAGGMPIVLLHGIGSNASSFASLMAAFDARSLSTGRTRPTTRPP